jgi:NodT family efflux transporter outer membrane factor (OMF) lipoprotein
MNRTNLNRLKLRTFLTLGVTTLSAGCVTVGPDYEPMVLEAPAEWAQAQAPTEQPTALPVPTDLWWHGFDDPQLVQLVERSRVENLDLRTAGSRIAQARANLGISRSDRFPVGEASGSRTRSQSSEAVGTGREVDFYRVGLDAGWELDLFGGTRRSIEAAVADLEGRVADHQAALISVSAETALRYVEIRALQRRLEIATDNLAAQQDTYKLTQFRAQAGLSTELDVQLARSNLESTRARVPDLESQLAKTRHALSVLLGAPPGTLDEELEASGPIPTASPDIAVGVPAEVLRRRPDVRSAERAVAAQSALVGVATAQLYPSLRLSGSIGLEALSLDGLTGGNATAWSFGPSISLPIFNRGKLRRGVDLQVELLEQSEINYRKTVLGALSEVEDALVALRAERERQEAYQEATLAAANAVELSLTLYRTGISDFQAVLEAQRSLYSLEDLLAQSQAGETTSLIRLYKAVGGGWFVDEESPIGASDMEEVQTPAGD